MNSENETPQESIGRGLRLGVLLFFLFLVSAVVAFFLVGALGETGLSQILIALLLGPFIGSGLFGLYWLQKQAPST